MIKSVLKNIRHTQNQYLDSVGNKIPSDIFKLQILLLCIEPALFDLFEGVVFIGGRHVGDLCFEIIETFGHLQS